MIAGKALRYKSILASVLSLRGQGIFLEHLPKSDMFDSFSSPLPQVLHTPSFWCWSQSPGEGGRKKKAEDSCYGLSGTEASTENSVKPGRERGELEHFIIQQYLGVWVYVCVRSCVYVCAHVCVCVCNRKTSRHYLIDITKCFCCRENRQAGMSLRFKCWGLRVWSSRNNVMKRIKREPVIVVN